MLIWSSLNKNKNDKYIHMYGRTDGRIRTDRWTYRRMDVRTDGPADGRTCGRIDGRTCGGTDGRTDGQTDVRTQKNSSRNTYQHRRSGVKQWICKYLTLNTMVNDINDMTARWQVNFFSVLKCVWAWPWPWPFEWPNLKCKYANRKSARDFLLCCQQQRLPQSVIVCNRNEHDLTLTFRIG